MMRTSGRMKLYMSIGLAILLLIQIIVFFSLKPGPTNGIVLIFGIIILLAFIAVYANYNNLKKTELRVQTLPKDFQIFYIDANESIALSSMTKAQKKDTMEMILEILEHATADGRSLESIAGNDLNGFLTGFITATGGRLTPLYLFGYSLASFVFYLLMMKIYKVFRSGSGTFADIESHTLDVGIVVTYALIGFIFMPWLLTILQKAASNQWSGIKRLKILIPFTIPMGLMTMLIFIDNNDIRDFLDQPLPLLGNIWLISLGILLALGGILITIYARKRQLHHNYGK